MRIFTLYRSKFSLYFCYIGQLDPSFSDGPKANRQFQVPNLANNEVAKVCEESLPHLNGSVWHGFVLKVVGLKISQPNLTEINSTDIEFTVVLALSTSFGNETLGFFHFLYNPPFTDINLT